MHSAKDALDRLKSGNQRFVSRLAESHKVPALQLDLPQEQAPFAIILGCSDARVPAEIVFDQGPGDLFVIRVAGNIVAPSQLGSIEFAAGQLGCRLVVVMGHTRCGAVQATLNALHDREHPPSPNLQSIVNFIRPALEPMLADSAASAAADLMQDAVEANTRQSVDRIYGDSAVLQNLVDNDGLQIVGAEYSLETGTVRFLDK